MSRLSKIAGKDAAISAGLGIGAGAIAGLGTYGLLGQSKKLEKEKLARAIAASVVGGLTGGAAFITANQFSPQLMKAYHKSGDFVKDMVSKAVNPRKANGASKEEAEGKKSSSSKSSPTSGLAKAWSDVKSSASSKVKGSTSAGSALSKAWANVKSSAPSKEKGSTSTGSDVSKLWTNAKAAAFLKGVISKSFSKRK